MRKPYIKFSAVVAAPLVTPAKVLWSLFRDGKLHGALLGDPVRILEAYRVSFPEANWSVK